MTVAWVWISVVLFGLLHSATASEACKRITPLKASHYRLLYVLLHTILTLGWMYWLHSLPAEHLYQLQGATKYALHLLQGIGVLLLWLSLQPIDTIAFLGLRPFDAASGEAFVERGIYRHLRHPMYSGVMLLLLASPVQTNVTLHFAFAISLYMVLGARWEEQRMQGRHPAYADYRQRVPAFIPRIRS